MIKINKFPNKVAKLNLRPCSGLYKSQGEQIHCSHLKGIIKRRSGISKILCCLPEQVNCFCNILKGFTGTFCMCQFAVIHCTIIQCKRTFSICYRNLVSFSKVLSRNSLNGHIVEFFCVIILRQKCFCLIVSFHCKC